MNDWYTTTGQRNGVTRVKGVDTLPYYYVMYGQFGPNLL